VSPYLDSEGLLKTRSRKVCMTCHWFRHHAGVNCIPEHTSPVAGRAGPTTRPGAKAGRRRWPEQGAMNVVDRPGRPRLSPQEGWLSDGRQVLHFRPRRDDRWSQSLEVTFGEVMAGGEPPLLKRQQGWQPC